MGEKSQKLRALLADEGPLMAGDCYSALTARIIEHVGFKAGYAGGHACGAFHYAVPDYGMYSQSEHVDMCRRIADAVGIPLIADADTLGDTIGEAFHYVRRYEAAGIAGLHVEDEANPRHSTFVNGLIEIGEMQARIDACVSARQDDAFVVIARCDEYYWQIHRGIREGRIEEAIVRGKAYAEAGADFMMYPVCPEEDHAILVEELPIPVCVIGNTMPGAKLQLAAGWGWLGAAQLHLERARKVLETGKIDVDPVLPDKAELIDQLLFDEVIRDWAERTGRPTW